jgi:hypothetical protein
MRKYHVKGKKFIYDKVTGKMVPLESKLTIPKGKDDTEVSILEVPTGDLALAVLSSDRTITQPKTEEEAQRAMSIVLDKADETAECHERRVCVRLQEKFDEVRERYLE